VCESHGVIREISVKRKEGIRRENDREGKEERQKIIIQEVLGELIAYFFHMIWTA
jgi:hypothetical protein